MTDPNTYGRHAAKYETVTAAEIEPKVKAGTIAAGASGIVTTFVVWLLDLIFWNGEADPSVPLPVTALVGLAVSAGMVFVAAFYARHVNRLPVDGA